MTYSMMRFLCVLLLIVLGVGVAYAQEATEEPPAPTLLSFDDLGYRSAALNGAFGTAQIYIPISSTWESAQDAEVSLSLVSSPLLRSISSITAFVNNQPIASAPLTGSAQTLNFTIPADFVQPPGMLLQLRGYLRVTDDQCEDSNIPSQWVRILGESTLSLHLTQTDALPQLSDLSTLLFSRSLTGTPDSLLFVLPDNPDSATLTAVSRIAAGLGMLIRSNTYPLEIVTASEVEAAQLEDANVVIVGLPGQQPLLDELRPALSTLDANGAFYTDDNAPVPEADAVVQVVRSPWNPERHVLVISANGAAGIENSGTIFLDRPTVQGMEGNYLFADSPLPPENNAPVEVWSGESTTLDQLGFGPRMVRGTGTVSEYYTILRAPGTLFAPGAQFVLRGSASPLLHNDQSYVSVFLNESPLGAYAAADLTQDGLAFQIPALIDQNRYSQQLMLRVEVSNQVLNSQCQTTDRENAWTFIDSSSGFVVDNRPLPLPNLEAFPYPFASAQPDAPVYLIVPDSVSPAYLGGVVRMGFTLGMFSPNSLDLRVVKSGELSEAAYDSHLIFLLDANTQPDIQVFFPDLSADQGEITPEAAPTSELFNPRTLELLNLSLYRALSEPFGLLFTDESPLAEDRMVLFVISSTDAGFETTVDRLTRDFPLVATAGNVAVVQEDQAPYLLYRPQDVSAITGEDIQAASTEAPAAGADTEESETADASSSTAISAGNASFVIIVIPIAISLILIVVIWALRRGRWNG